MKIGHKTARLLVLATAALVLAVALTAIAGYERILAQGQVALLELLPVDPRSLMQGDFMALDYALNRQLMGETEMEELLAARYAVLELDSAQRATLSYLSDVLPTDGQLAVRIRWHNGQPSIGPNAFFFEEGLGPALAGARWGEFRIADDGRAVLTHLRDGELRRLGAQRW